MTDQRICQLAFFGRAVDALTRRVVDAPELSISVSGEHPPVTYKQDGYFAIADLTPRPADYQVAVHSVGYRPRLIQKALPTADPVELVFDGEDELIVHCSGASASQLTFVNISFLPLIKRGATVIGQGGPASTLDADAFGTDVTFVRTAIGTALANKVVRVVRSRALVLRPGPYYAFPASTTLIALRVVADIPASPPIASAAVSLMQVDGNAITSVAVGSVSVKKAQLAAMTSPDYVLGTPDDVELTTNSRGDALFYFTPGVPVASIRVNVAATGYVTSATNITATTGKRVFKEIRLIPS